MGVATTYSFPDWVGSGKSASSIGLPEDAATRQPNQMIHPTSRSFFHLSQVQKREVIEEDRRIALLSQIQNRFDPLTFDSSPPWQGGEEENNRA